MYAYNGLVDVTSIVVVDSVVGSVVVMGSVIGVAFVIFIGVIYAAASAGFPVVSIIGEFLLPLWFTWVHSSSLLGWSPVSRFLL